LNVNEIWLGVRRTARNKRGSPFEVQENKEKVKSTREERAPGGRYAAQKARADRPDGDINGNDTACVFAFSLNHMPTTEN
jgi:hypothetical protein